MTRRRKHIFYLDIEMLNYSLNSIRATFIDGRTLLRMAQDVVEGRLTLHEMDPMLVRSDTRTGAFYVRKGNRRLFVAKRLFEHGCIDAGSTLPCAWYYGIKPFTAKTGVALRLRGRDFSSEIDVLLLSVKLSFSTVKDLITIQNDVHLQQNSKKSMAVERKQPLVTAAVCVYHEMNESGDHR